MEIQGAGPGALDPGLGVGRLGVGASGRISGRELRDFANEQRRIALDELKTFAEAVARHRQRQGDLEADLALAWADLLELILPSLDAPP